MILMPYYGVKMSKNFVQNNKMLENKNTVTVRSEGKDVFYFALPVICGSDTLVTSKQLEENKVDLDEDFEVLMSKQKQEVSQVLCTGEREFFVTVMDY
jgi:hypothetical protein